MKMELSCHKFKVCLYELYAKIKQTCEYVHEYEYIYEYMYVL